MAAAHVEEPMLSRLNRLDIILKQLEDIKGINYYSPKSSFTSTTSSGSLSFDGYFSQECIEKHCRPVNEVMMEVETKGTLIERLVHAEDRILKLLLQLEDEVESEKSRELAAEEKHLHLHSHSHSPKKALKKFVKSCVVGKGSSKKMAKA